jgi:hypothetical protein
MVQHRRINQATQPTLTADPGSATPPHKALPPATLKMDLTNPLKRTAEAEDESKRPELKKLKLEMTYTNPGSDPTAATPNASATSPESRSGDHTVWSYVILNDKDRIPGIDLVQDAVKALTELDIGEPYVGRLSKGIGRVLQCHRLNSGIQFGVAIKIALFTKTIPSGKDKKEIVLDQGVVEPIHNYLTQKSIKTDKMRELYRNPALLTQLIDTDLIFAETEWQKVLGSQEAGEMWKCGQARLTGMTKSGPVVVVISPASGL